MSGGSADRRCALSPETGLLPAGFGIRLDAGTRCSGDGRSLIGGSPLRRLRLSVPAANLLANLRDGEPATTRSSRQLGRRLCEAGMAHPVPPPGGPEPAEVTCVIPVRDDPEGLAELLRSLEANQPVPGNVVIAEDGSRDPQAPAELARTHNADIIQRVAARGPAAARNEAWRTAGTGVVAFLDSDVTVGPDWLSPLLAHFRDPTVAAVAPRVRAPAEASSMLGRFERHNSPLDMGPQPSIVAPGRRVRYVPSAALLFRRDVLDELDGFDEDLRVGEDVDLIWRAAAAGWTVRYEPNVSLEHRTRPSWTALGRQRCAYGTSTAPLAARHPAAVAPLEIAPWSLAAWAALVVLGRKGVTPAAMVVSAALRRLHGTLAERGGATSADTARLVLATQLASGQRMAVALRRTWLPLTLAATAWTWGRRLALAALMIEPLTAWAIRKPDLGPLRWIAATIFSDAAYCTGVWRGGAAERSPAALRPRLIARAADNQGRGCRWTP